MTERKTRRRYDETFKKKAVQMLAENGKTVTAIAAFLGVERTNLQKWKKKYWHEVVKSDKGAVPENGEIISLKREVQSIRETMDSLRNIVLKSLGERYMGAE